MGKDLEVFICSRCELELQKSKEYISLQKELEDAYKGNDLFAYSELTIKMQIIVEFLCYKKARKDLFCELFGY